jgi:uncharacterized protein YndB with AHSA1/START domain
MAELRHQIEIDAPAKRVFDAVGTEAGFRGWWTADARVEERAGGRAEFGFENRQMIFRMTIEQFEPGKRVLMRCSGDHPDWSGTTLTWEVVEQDGPSVLRFTHSGWKSVGDYFANCNSTWGELMYRLRDYVEGRKPGPHWRE